MTFDFWRRFDDNECSDVYEKTPCRWLHIGMGARTPGRVRPNAVVASPILPDPPLSGKGPRMDIRQQRGQQIASTCVIIPKDGYWVVPSQSGQGRYKVRIDPAPATCEC